MKKLNYRQIYKYELTARHYDTTRCDVPHTIKLDGWITLWAGGRIDIGDRYSWDGPSGPARDTPNFMRASLVHDALYQLIQEGLLPREYRKKADQTMRDIAQQDGMSGFRRWYTFWAVRIFGGSHAKA
jgi:hypothetical protein